MQNSILEYASTANISTTPPFHIHDVATFIPSKERLKFYFLLKYFQKTLSSSSNKEPEQKKKKKTKKQRAPKVSREERDVIFIEDKIISTSNLFV
jgi:hypothetical protein